MFATAQAKEKGYDQVLWTDAFEHKYVQECGTMNVFFIIGNTAITPGLEQGTILDGVTRQSTITLLKEMGFSVEERALSIDDIIDAYKANLLYEVFGTGTAATISMIKELRYKDFVMHFNVDAWKTAPTIKKWLTDIRESRREDKYNWMEKV
jgi:branched-chain amino acid aminotransferase